MDTRRELDVHEFRSGHAQAFLSFMRVTPEAKGRETVSNRSVERHRAVLSSLFSFAEELELIEYNQVRKVRPPKVDRRDPVIITDAQLDRLLAETKASPMVYLYVMVLAEARLRSGSEALWLQWPDVDLEEGFLRIVSGRHNHRTKSGAERWVPMTPRLRQEMKEHFARYRFDGSPWVFHHTLRKRHAEKGARIRGLHRAFRSAAERTKLPLKLRQHDLRH